MSANSHSDPCTNVVDLRQCAMGRTHLGPCRPRHYTEDEARAFRDWLGEALTVLDELVVAARISGSANEPDLKNACAEASAFMERMVATPGADRGTDK